jgi:hypothetical protein
VLELALKSDELQLASENDAYALVGAWIASQELDAVCETFEGLVKCLRLHHMSPAFLNSVMFRSDLRDDWPGLLVHCANAFAYQSMAATLSSPNISKHPFSCKPRRSPAAFKYELEAKVQLADCLDIDQRPDRVVATRLGIADGYLIELRVRRRRFNKDAPATVGLYLGIRCPDTEKVASEEADTVRYTGPIVRWQVEVNGRGAKDFRFLYALTDALPYDSRNNLNALGSPDFFEKPWDEVVREGSDYFPQGRMTVKVKARFLSDLHVPEGGGGGREEGVGSDSEEQVG